MVDHKDCSHQKEPLFTYVRDCYWSIFRANTAILSSTCRQLALGIGGVLLIDKSNGFSICPFWIKSIFTLLVLFFILDAAQYFNQSRAFKKLATRYDDEIETGNISDLSELIEEPGMNNLTDKLFFYKLVVLALISIIFVIIIWWL